MARSDEPIVAGNVGTGVFNVETTTPLGASQTFVGPTRDTQMGSGGGVYHWFLVLAKADQSGTMFIEVSYDGVSFFRPDNGATAGDYVASLSANDTVVLRAFIPTRYVRVKFTNGPNPQGNLKIYSKHAGGY